MDPTAGDAMGGLRRTRKTTPNLAQVRKRLAKTHKLERGQPFRLLVLEADRESANNPCPWARRVDLQRTADEFSLTITVGFPQGASKWNLIEHRMLNLITATKAGQPLVRYELVLKCPRNTRTTTGLRCRETLHQSFCPTKAKITDDEDRKGMIRHRVLSNWN
jgi:hypothetical protein